MTKQSRFLECCVPATDSELRILPKTVRIFGRLENAEMFMISCIFLIRVVFLIDLSIKAFENWNPQHRMFRPWTFIPEGKKSERCGIFSMNKELCVIGRYTHVKYSEPSTLPRSTYYPDSRSLCNCPVCPENMRFWLQFAIFYYTRWVSRLFKAYAKN